MGVLDACCSALEAKSYDIPIQAPVSAAPAAAPVSGATGAIESAAAMAIELQLLSLTQLKHRASLAGVPGQMIASAEGSPDPKSAVIALVVGQATFAANAPSVDGAVGQIFNALDGDGDGAISMHELPQTPVTGAIFSFLDKDGDGKITNAELLAGFTALSGLAFMYVSKNGVPKELHAYLSMIPASEMWLPAAAK
jgi:hypothetical protein